MCSDHDNVDDTVTPRSLYVEAVRIVRSLEWY